MNGRSPLISVVVSTFRRPAYLRRALQSVVAQSHRRLEVIVADDGADEETAAVVASFEDARLRYLPRSERLGILANNLDALRSATGTYLIKLDDDDLWHERLCATLLSPLERDASLAVAFSDHWLVDENGTIDNEATEQNSRRWGRTSLAGGKHRPFRALAIEGTLPAQLATLYRRDSLDWSSFPSEIGGVYDWWLAYLAARSGAGAFYVPERLAYYRLHGGSYTMSGRALMARETVRAYELALADPAMADVRPRLRELVAAFQATLALTLLRDDPGAGPVAAAAAKRSLRLHPSRRGATALAVSMLPAGARQTLLWNREALG